MGGVIPSEEFNEQLTKAVRESERRIRSQMVRQGRWHKKGGGGGSCNCGNFYVVGTQGVVSSGSFDLTVGYKDTDDDDQSESVTINHNETKETLQPKIAALAKMPDNVSVTGGPLPINALTIQSPQGVVTSVEAPIEGNDLVGEFVRPFTMSLPGSD